MRLRLVLQLCIVGCVIDAVTSQAITPPSITSSFDSSTIYFSPNEGELLTLPCVATGTPKPTYEWRFNGVTISNPPLKSDGTLEYVSPDSSKQGYYQCIAMNSAGSAYSNKTRVLMATQAQFAAESSTVVKSAAVGSSLTVICQPIKTTVPAPLQTYYKKDFDWRYDSGVSFSLGRRAQIDDIGNLQIAYVTMDDNMPSGTLTCYITNRKSAVSVGGSYARISVTSSVAPPQSPPAIMFYTNQTMNPLNPSKPSTTVVALEGRNQSLRCFFSGSDNINIQWTRQGGSIPTDGRIEMLNYNIELFIKNVQKSDEGTYVCTGTAGSSTDFPMNVIVQAAPVFKTVDSKPHDVNTTVGVEVVLMCNPYAIPDVSVVWFQNGRILDPTSDQDKKKFSWSDDRKMMTVLRPCQDQCGPNDNGPMVIQCNASNVHGYAFSNGYINVYVKTILVTKPPEQVLPTLNQRLNFSVWATSDPNTPITYTWYFIRNNEQRLIVNSDDYTLSNDSTTLIINNVDEPVIGQYKIIATNGISQDEFVVSLLEPPGLGKSSVWPFWWIPFIIILIVVLFIIIVCCVCCCIYRNRGDEYPVDEKEREADRNPEKELADSGFHDYQRPTGRQDIERQPLTRENR